MGAGASAGMGKHAQVQLVAARRNARAGLRRTVSVPVSIAPSYSAIHYQFTACAYTILLQFVNYKIHSYKYTAVYLCVTVTFIHTN